jgi:MFS transporter, SP family, general alpha glucoside:H+ symporter
MGRRNSSVVEVPADNNALHVEDTVVRKASVAVENFAGLSSEAKDATDQEHSMSFMQAIKLYPKAVGWSMLLSTAIIMEGYDVVLLSSFYALPQFNEKYGVCTSFLHRSPLSVQSTTETITWRPSSSLCPSLY